MLQSIWTWLSLVAVYFIWGSTYLAVRVGLDSVPPFLFTGTRFCVAGGLLLALAAVLGWRTPSRGDWLRSLALATTMLFVSSGACAAALRTVDTGLATVVASLNPCWIVMIDAFVSRQTIRSRLLLGVGFGVAASVLLVSPPGSSGPSWDGLATGVPVLLLAGFAWALGTVLAARIPTRLSAWQSTGLTMSIGGLQLLVLAAVTGERLVNGSGDRAAAWAAWSYLVIFGSIIVFVAYEHLLRHASPALVSSHAYANPVVALTLGWWFLGEEITHSVFLACALTLPALFLILTSDRSTGSSAGFSQPLSMPEEDCSSSAESDRPAVAFATKSQGRAA